MSDQQIQGLDYVLDRGIQSIRREYEVTIRSLRQRVEALATAVEQGDTERQREIIREWRANA